MAAIAAARAHRRRPARSSACPATTTSRARARRAAEGADYVAFGSFFASRSQAGRAPRRSSSLLRDAQALRRAGGRDRRHHRRQRARAVRRGRRRGRGDLRRVRSRRWPTSRTRRALADCRARGRASAQAPRRSCQRMRRSAHEPRDEPQRRALRARAAHDSRRRQLAGARVPLGRRHAAVLRARAGPVCLGCRRQALHRLRRVRGARRSSATPSRRSCARCSSAPRSGLSFGAPTELEIEMAETLCRRLPSLELVRLVSSGTEATMSALRLARGFTGPQQDRQVRRLLPRPRRQPAGEGGLGRADVRPAVVGRRAAGDRQRNAGAALQRHRGARSAVRAPKATRSPA